MNKKDWIETFNTKYSYLTLSLTEELLEQFEKKCSDLFKNGYYWHTDKYEKVKNWLQEQEPKQQKKKDKVKYLINI